MSWRSFQLAASDVIFYPTGGWHRPHRDVEGVEELQALGWMDSHRPRMVVGQGRGCAPIVKAFQDGVEVAEAGADASTLAGGLAFRMLLGVG